MSLAINPSYRTYETVYDSCPCGSASSCTTDQVKVEQWTKNYPRVHGDSILGTYGATNYRFANPPPKVCNPCDQPCEQNVVSTLFYRPIRPIVHPTYGFKYQGKDELFRNPY